MLQTIVLSSKLHDWRGYKALRYDIKRALLLWNALTLTFFFLFYLFFLILYFFSFEFLFLFSDNEEARDIAVT